MNLYSGHKAKKKDSKLEQNIYLAEIRAETKKNSLDPGEKSVLDKPGLQEPD